MVISIIKACVLLVKVAVIQYIITFTHTLGPPGIITNLTILFDMTTSTSFVAHWSEPSSNVVCGPVQYIVIVSTGGMVITTDTINGTTFNVTGHAMYSSYTINLTAYNAAGIGSSTIKQVTTNNNHGKDILAFNCM